jgi:hypothetical protein
VLEQIKILRFLERVNNDFGDAFSFLEQDLSSAVLEVRFRILFRVYLPEELLNRNSAYTVQVLHQLLFHIQRHCQLQLLQQVFDLGFVNLLDFEHLQVLLL